MSEFVTLKDAAAMTGLSERTIRRWVASLRVRARRSERGVEVEKSFVDTIGTIQKQKAKTDNWIRGEDDRGV